MRPFSGPAVMPGYSLFLLCVGSHVSLSVGEEASPSSLVLRVFLRLWHAQLCVCLFFACVTRTCAVSSLFDTVHACSSRAPLFGRQAHFALLLPVRLVLGLPPVTHPFCTWLSVFSSVTRPLLRWRPSCTRHASFIGYPVPRFLTHSVCRPAMRPSLVPFWTDMPFTACPFTMICLVVVYVRPFSHAAVL
ncbi:hypothetical protein TRVL_07189 [Trypanosoma vivax]|nr:hypothetical protein TRVL_07189 [Trypanosoma vivax]